MILLKIVEMSIFVSLNIDLFMIFNENISKNEETNFTITHRSMECQTEFYGLSKKSKIPEREVLYLIKQLN